MSFSDLVKRANEEKRKKEEEKKGTTARSSFENLVTKAYSGDTSTYFTADDVNRWNSSIQGVGKRAYDYLSTDKYKQADTALANEIDKYLSEADYVLQYIRANKNGIKNYDNVYSSIIDTKNALSMYSKSIHDTNDFLSQFSSEKQYDDFKIGWLNPEAEVNAEMSAGRKDRYTSNQNRISEIEGKLKSVAGSWLPNGIENWFLSDEEEDLRDEMERLKAENLQYERTQGALDKYYAPETPEFLANGAYRDYTNASRDDLSTINANEHYINDLLTSYGTFDGQGNIVNATTGDIIYQADDLSRAMYKNATEGGGGLLDKWTGNDAPNYIDEYYKSLVQDKLGMFLSSSEDERAEAVSELTAGAGNNNNTWAEIIRDGDALGWEQLTEYEINLYYDILKREGQAAAYGYLDAMTTVLTRRATEERAKEIADATLLEQIALNIASVPMNTVGGAVGLIEDVGNMLSGKDINPYSEAHSWANDASAIRQETASDINEATGNAALPWVGTTFGDVYQSIMSFADSALASYVPGGSALLGANAATSTMKNLYDRGASQEQMLAGGVLAGAAETFFEHFSIGQLKQLRDVDTKAVKSVTDWFVRAAIMGGFEASEEMATEAANTISDALVMGSQTDWEDFETFLKNVVNAGIGGFISGGFGGGIAAGINKAQYDSRVKDHGQSIIDNGGVDPLKALALEMSGESQSKQDKQISGLADKVTKKASPKNVGRLSERMESSITSKNEAALTKALAERGLSDMGAAKVAKYILDSNELSETDVATIEGSERIQKAMDEVLADPNLDISDASVRLHGARLGVKASTASEVVTGLAEKAAVAKSEAETLNATETKFEASADGKTVYRDARGNTVDASIKRIASTEGGIKVELESGETVKASDISFGTQEEALMYEMVARMEATPETANEIISTFKPSDIGQATKLFTTVPRAYQYGQMGYEAGLKNVAMPDNLKKIVYNRGRMDAMLQDESKQAKIDSIGAINANKDSQIASVSKKGIIFENGYVYDESKANDLQKASMVGIEAIHKMSNLEVHAYESKLVNGKRVAIVNGKEVTANGFFIEGGNKIYIDINAGNGGEGAMLYTMSHEVGHYIRNWNAKGFREIGDFLVGEYSKGGTPVQALLGEQKRKLKERYARSGEAMPSEAKLNDMAYEEMVCDAVSEMLADPMAYEKLAKLKQKDRTLWQKFGEAIKALLDKLKTALGVYKEKDVSTTQEALFVRGFSKEAYDKLQDLYIKAFAEADANYGALAESGIIVDSKTESATLMSVRDVLSEEDSKKVAKALAERFGVTQAEAMDWLKAETSLASLILNPKYSQYLDYTADPNEEAIKSNSDYPQGTVDFSNICKKRRDFTEVMNRVLRNFPNHVFAATDLAKIRTIMEEEGMEVACAICYVEDRRQLDSVVAQDFIDSLAIYRDGGKNRPDGKPFNANQLKAFDLIEGDTYTPSIYELISLEGRNALKAKNPEMEQAWVKFNNARGMQSVRLLLNDAEYKRQILKYTPAVVKRKNDLGGLRIYSFSDAEMFHLIDIIQVITDSATVGLSLQGYTKVNEYAKAVKDTGEKLNRSLIPKGDLGYHMEGGRVVLDFDTTEGIDINHPDFFDNIDNPNIGNIVIGINATQIKAAMTSKFIDQIIPFHTGQSGEVLGEKGIAAWENYKDSQSERDVKTGKKSSHQINIYTEVINAAEAEGKPITNKVDFVNKFLEVCKKNNLIPRFSEFLNVNENGEYVYTEGYHKLLVDFKTFAQTEVGEYLPQMPVKPIFDNEYITGLLTDYVKSQKAKDAKTAKSMPKVLDRITKEIVKLGETKYSERDSYAPVFYSHMGRVIDEIKLEKMGASSILNHLKNRGVKDEEIKWSGIEAWLEGKKSVTKTELQEFVAGSQLRIKEQMSDDEEYTHWSEYKLDGGSNYREIAFQMPGSDYSNSAMRTHWGDDAEGILAHARIQDFTVDGKKMLFVEEIQSDWHNEGHTEGYGDPKKAADLKLKALALDDKNKTERRSLIEILAKHLEGKVDTPEAAAKSFLDFAYVNDSLYVKYIQKYDIPIDLVVRMNKLRKSRDEANSLHSQSYDLERGIPDAPFRTTYHEYVLKRLIRMAAEEGYDSIGWTTADIQSQRWSDEYAEGYRIEYDQDIPKFLRKYGKKWGATVGKTALPYYEPNATYYDVNRQEEYRSFTEWQNVVEQGLKAQGAPMRNLKYESDDNYWIAFDKVSGIEYDRAEIRKTSGGVWSMTIPDSMKESVLYEGQVMYQERESTSVSNRSLLAGALEGVAQNDIEKQKLGQYKAKIAQVEAEQKRLGEIRAEANKLRFTKGRTAEETKRMRELDAEATKIANRISTYDKQLLGLESTKALKGVLEREKAKLKKRLEAEGRKALSEQRQKNAEAVKGIVSHYQESRKKAVEGRNKTAMRHKIQKAARDLDSILNNGTKQRNVKNGERGIVRAALDLSEMLFATDDEIIVNGLAVELSDGEAKAVSDYLKLYEEYHSYDDAVTENKARRAELRSLMTEVKRGFADALERERKRISKAKASAAFDALITEYKKLAGAEDDHLKLAYKPEVVEYIEALKSGVGDTLVSEMTLQQLESVYKAFKMIKEMVTNSNKIWRQGKRESMEERRDAIFSELSRLKSRSKDHPELIGKALNRINEFGWNNLRPVDAFEMIGSDSLTELFWDVIEAQSVYAKDIEEVKDAIVKARQKYGYKKWDVNETKSFEMPDGRTFTVTLVEMMSIYAYSKRDQADDHMREGGFQHAKGAVYKDGKVMKLRSNESLTYKVDDKLRLDIMNSLTKEQRDYATEMQTLLTSFGEKGNEASRILYGIDLFTEEVYFPLMSSHDYLASMQTQLGQTATTASLAGIGIAKPTVPHANNPIILQAFDDVILEHFDKMSKYHAYAVVIDNLRKMLDAQGVDINENMVSIKALIGERLGDGARDYLQNYITDLNGSASISGAKNPLESLFGKAKGASVSANLSVWVQQYFSVIRAFSEVNPRYFIPFMGDQHTKGDMKAYEEMKRYAPIATIKEMGGFDVGSNRGIKDYIGYEETGASKGKVAKKMQDGFGIGANLMDKLGWTTIWKGIKKEVAASGKYKVGSEEYLKACGKRFEEVIVKTQVYDSVNARSGYMRSKHGTVKYLVSFMGEPTTIAGMAEVSIVKLKRAIASGNKGAIKKATGRLAATMSAIAVSTAMTSIAKSLVYAMRDDDEDETYLEKYAEALGGAFKDDIKLFNYLPIARDIASIFEGRSIERPDMTLIEDLIDSYLKLRDSLGDEDATSEDKWSDGFKLAGAITNIFGIPAKNIWRDLKGLVNTLSGIGKGYDSGVGKNFVEGWTGEDAKKGDDLYAAIVNGDTKRVEYYHSTYKDESSYNTAVRKALRENDPRIKEAAEAKLNGDSAKSTHIAEEIEREGHFSREDIKAAINTEVNNLKEDDTSVDDSDIQKDEAISWYDASDINIAFEEGDTAHAKEIIQDLIDTKVANGKTEKEAKSSLRSSMTSYWKPLYKAAYQSGDNAEMLRIRRILYASDLYGSQGDVVDAVKSWLKN